MGNVRSVERAVKIMKVIGSNGGGATVSEISTKLNLHSTTVIRLLATLKDEGFVSRDLDTLSYRLGNSLIEMVNNMSNSNYIHAVVRPIMHELVKETKETVALYVINGSKRVCAERIEGLHPIRWHIEIGDSAPLGISSSGKLLLAHSSRPFMDNILKKQLFYIDGSMVDTEKLKKELDLIRHRGYACSFCENSPDGAGISAPIMNSQGKTIASLTILGPTSRINIDNIELYKDVLISTAKQISLKLGFKG